MRDKLLIIIGSIVGFWIFWTFPVVALKGSTEEAEMLSQIQEEEESSLASLATTRDALPASTLLLAAKDDLRAFFDELPTIDIENEGGLDEWFKTQISPIRSLTNVLDNLILTVSFTPPSLAAETSVNNLYKSSVSISYSGLENCYYAYSFLQLFMPLNEDGFTDGRRTYPWIIPDTLNISIGTNLPKTDNKVHLDGCVDSLLFEKIADYLGVELVGDIQESDLEEEEAENEEEMEEEAPAAFFSVTFEMLFKSMENADENVNAPDAGEEEMIDVPAEKSDLEIIHSDQNPILWPLFYLLDFNTYRALENEVRVELEEKERQSRLAGLPSADDILPILAEGEDE